MAGNGIADLLGNKLTLEERIIECVSDVPSEPPPVCRRLQSKYGWSLWKKATELTDFRLKCVPARFG